MKSKSKRKRRNIGVVTPILMKSGVVPTLNILNILESLADDLHVIEVDADGNLPNLSEENKRIHIYSGIMHRRGSNIVTRIGNYIYTQIRISCRLLRVSKNVDLWIFYGGGSPLSMLSAKLLRKKVVLATAASSTQILKTANDNLFKLVEILSKINYTLSNRIILYSPSLIKEWNLEIYKNKICIAHEHFLDFDKFKIKKKFDERDNLVGYIGRLSEEKGTLNFVKAIPEIMKERDDVKFLIGGDGGLRNEIEKYLKKKSLTDKIKLPGWVPREEFLTYLNELKLFVLPSYTEGLPHTILEAMACGTPVLATPVGAIPDVIKDGETGFIMENNSPACIAKNVIRALAHPNINEITKNARALVEEKYNYQTAVDGYRIILSSTF